jgi:hypothetical protein
MWQRKLPSHVCPLEETGRWHLQWTKKVSILKYPDWFLCIFLKSVKDCVWEEIFAPQQTSLGPWLRVFFPPSSWKLCEVPKMALGPQTNMNVSANHS